MSDTQLDFDGHRIIVPHDRWSTIAAATPPDPTPKRLVYAAAHVVLLPEYARIDHSTTHPGRPDELADFIDWDATMGFRRHLASHGFGIAEAMDTAQRFELGWTAARALIRRCGALQLPTGFVAGASCDQRRDVDTPAKLIEAVSEQVHEIQAAGGIAVLLPMLQLPHWQADEDCYVEVYTSIIDACRGPLIAHWLGEMFLPALKGYFPGDSFARIMRHDPQKLRGAKLSLLNADLERRLNLDFCTRGQIMLTGDDENFAQLIVGEGPTEQVVWLGERQVELGPFSHGLLGIFDGIANPAHLALRALAAGQTQDARTILAACQRLSRVIFEPPVPLYKAGLAFLSWLNGHQDTFDLVNHMQRDRPQSHYRRVLELAAAAGALTNPPLARDRLAAHESC